MKPRWRPVALVLGVTVLLGLLEASQGRLLLARVPASQFWPEALLRTMPGWLLRAALLPLIVAFTRRWRLSGPGHPRRIALHVVAGFAFVLLHLSGLALFAALMQDVPQEFGRFLVQSIYRGTATGVVFYWGVVCACEVLWHRRELRERELAESRLRAQLAEARLGALRAQLNPHFLFNTLNAISTLALRGERERLLGALDALCSLLRVALEEGHDTWKTLAEEMHFVDRYLAIQELRFGDRLRIERDVADAALGARVPSLLLQPIVENAVEHGVARHPGPGCVRIRAAREDLVLTIEVADSGPGFAASGTAPAAGAPLRGGVGLSNTRERLAQLFGGRATLECFDGREGGAVVRIRLPWVASAAEAAAAGAGASR